jgi:hypothetical protein
MALLCGAARCSGWARALARGRPRPALLPPAAARGERGGAGGGARDYRGGAGDAGARGGRARARAPPPDELEDAGASGGGPPPGRLEYLVTCHPGLEGAVAEELRDPRIGAAAAEATQPGRVSFWWAGWRGARGPRRGRAGGARGGARIRGSRPAAPPRAPPTPTLPHTHAAPPRRADSQGVAYRAVLWLRAATRVLQLVAAEPLDPYRPAGDTVYEAARALLDWPLLLAPGQTLAVTAQVWSCSNVTNSQLVARRVRDAGCDAVRDARWGGVGARGALVGRGPGRVGACTAPSARDSRRLQRLTVPSHPPRPAQGRAAGAARGPGRPAAPRGAAAGHAVLVPRPGGRLTAPQRWTGVWGGWGWGVGSLHWRDECSPDSGRAFKAA